MKITLIQLEAVVELVRDTECDYIENADLEALVKLVQKIGTGKNV
jgi:hypothetical protein